MEIISEVVSLQAAGFLPLFLRRKSSIEGRGDGCCWPISDSVSLRCGDGGTGLMLKIPMSPVSVVVFSILSNAPGEGNKTEFSFTLRRGLCSGRAGEGP